MKLLLALLLSACAPGVDAARQTLANTAKVLDASAKTFEQFDKDHQISIAREYPPAIATEFIFKYRATREPLMKSFLVAGGVLTSAYALIPLLEHGLKKQRDFDALLVELFDASVAIRANLAKLNLPGGAL